MRIRSWFLGLLTVMCLSLTLSTPAMAQQDRLPSDMVTVEGQLNPQQAQTVRSYIQRRVQEMLQANTPQQVSESRELLLEPVRRPLATPSFKEAYGLAVANEIDPLLNNDQFVRRLNGLIIAAELQSSYTLDRVPAFFNDPNPAIRYWAAKAIAEAIGDGTGQGMGVSTDRQIQLLQPLREVIAREQSSTVLEQIYNALSAMTVPEAQATLIDVLGSRVTQYTDGIHEAIRADLEGLRRLQRQLIIAQTSGASNPQVIRSFVTVSARFLQVVAHAFQDGTVPQELQPVAQTLVETVETIFTSALQQLQAPVQQGPSLTQPLRLGNYDVLLLNVYEWVGSEGRPGILTNALGIPYEDLRLQAGAQPQQPLQTQPQ